MIQARLIICYVPASEFSSAGVIMHQISFSSVDAARAEYQRLRGILATAAGSRKYNSSPVEIVEVDGRCGSCVSFPSEGLRSVELVDYAEVDAHQRGAKEAFPNLRVMEG